MTRLGELRKGQLARIVAIGDEIAAAGAEAAPRGEEGAEEMIRRLMEMGLLEGSIVEIVHEAPFGGDPVAVRIRGALVALRRNEANHIQVIPQEAIHE